MASRPTNRPISPHLGIYKWGPHMLVSILHRATGDGMAVVGSVLLVWWLAAIAAGQEAYRSFQAMFVTASGTLSIVGIVIGVGLTFALFQHMMSGIRHLLLDTGAGYELKVNRAGAWLTLVFSVLLTVLFWLTLAVR